MPTESKDFIAGWLRGFFDGEGSVHFKRHRLTRGHRAGQMHTGRNVTITNTDDSLMDICGRYLTALGIEFREYYRPRSNPIHKAVRTIYIDRGSSLVEFYARVGFSTHHKAAKLEEAIDWINRPSAAEARQSEATRLWKEGHNIACIGVRLGLNHHVNGRDLGIPYKLRIGANGKRQRRVHCLCPCG